MKVFKSQNWPSDFKYMLDFLYVLLYVLCVFYNVYNFKQYINIKISDKVVRTFIHIATFAQALFLKAMWTLNSVCLKVHDIFLQTYYCTTPVVMNLVTWYEKA